MSVMARRSHTPSLADALYHDRDRLSRIVDRRYSRRMATPALIAAWAAAREARITGSRSTDELVEHIHDGQREATPAMIAAIDRADLAAQRHEEARILASEYGHEIADLYNQVGYRLEKASRLEHALSDEAARRLARITADWPRTTSRPEATR